MGGEVMCFTKNKQTNYRWAMYIHISVTPPKALVSKRVDVPAEIVEQKNRCLVL